MGGEATIDNIQLRCRAHNVYEAALFFGIGTSEARGSKAKGGSTELGPDLVDSQATKEGIGDEFPPAAAAGLVHGWSAIGDRPMKDRAPPEDQRE